MRWTILQSDFTLNLQRLYRRAVLDTSQKILYDLRARLCISVFQRYLASQGELRALGLDRRENSPGFRWMRDAVVKRWNSLSDRLLTYPLGRYFHHFYVRIGFRDRLDARVR